jgi:hypothetical protein
MAKISAPNEHYTGFSAGVAFVDGVGHTQDEHRIDWFKEHGYAVIAEAEDAIPFEKMTVDELKAYAEGKGINLENTTKKDEIIGKIRGDQ